MSRSGYMFTTCCTVRVIIMLYICTKIKYEVTRLKFSNARHLLSNHRQCKITYQAILTSQNVENRISPHAIKGIRGDCHLIEATMHLSLQHIVICSADNLRSILNYDYHSQSSYYHWLYLYIYIYICICQSCFITTSLKLSGIVLCIIYLVLYQNYDYWLWFKLQ